MSVNLKEGVKFDTFKIRFDLIPMRPLFELAKVYTLGCVKYTDRNWEKGMGWCRVFAAILRHLFAWFLGQKNDPKDGQLHLSSAAWGCFALMEYEHTHVELDDRPKLPEAEATKFLNEINQFIEDYARSKSTTGTTDSSK
jgi:hypothetical protein